MHSNHKTAEHRSRFASRSSCRLFAFCLSFTLIRCFPSLLSLREHRWESNHQVLVKIMKVLDQTCALSNRERYNRQDGCPSIENANLDLLFISFSWRARGSSRESQGSLHLLLLWTI
ncbi:hypothetical protein Ae201684_019048 [Aphanomyces euteiches]|uniref:Uncharacterized protein n=1 Tax=Aphanomyces euteiches TaxID=100861 RepID=A0A6G0W576_9STRA|nr:hypothetical protein Ae201684_019048 [Aphanomyces euteiches]